MCTQKTTRFGLLQRKWLICVGIRLPIVAYLTSSLRLSPQQKTRSERVMKKSIVHFVIVKIRRALYRLVPSAPYLHPRGSQHEQASIFCGVVHSVSRVVGRYSGAH